jgi:hypothetical protein
VQCHRELGRRDQLRDVPLMHSRWRFLQCRLELGGRTMLFSAESAFANFIADAFAVFIFILWFWLFITTASDLFRRRDISGFGKVLWVILLIVLPYIGIFAYIITQGGGMAERNKAQAIQARDELRQVIGFSIADELLKLDRLKSEKSISDEEYLRLRTRLVA